MTRIKALDLFARSRRLAQKLQVGVDAWVVREAADRSLER